MYAKGLNFDIEPKDMIKPKGSANTSVSAKIRQVVSKPSSNRSVTFKNDDQVIAMLYSFVVKITRLLQQA
jgi:hypothetical protein